MQQVLSKLRSVSFFEVCVIDAFILVCSSFLTGKIDLSKSLAAFPNEEESMTGFPGRFEVAVAALVLVGGLLLALFVGRKPSQSARRKLPPGPRGWPLLGSLQLLGTLPHRSLCDLSKKYGPLMLMHLGSVRTLVVSSPKFSENILKTHDKITSSRPNLVVASHVTYDASDMAWSPYGQHWRNMRKVCTLGLLTASRISQFKAIRQREVIAVLHFILEESQRGNAVNMNECFSTITMNNMTQIMMSKSYCVQSSSSSTLPTMSTWLPKLFNEMFELVGAFNLADYIPVLKPFDPQGLLKRIKVVRRRLDKFFDGVIVERRQRRSIEKAENHRADFVDVLLGFGQPLELGEPLSMNEVKANLLDMISAGGDTSSVTGLWALTELLKHPHLLRRVQRELDSVVGPHRLVQEEDLSKLQYLNAVVKETLRLHPPVPFLLPHVTTEDFEIEGFHIPARTRVLVNVWGMHRDPAVWEGPLEFDPDRFLNSTTDFKGLDFEFLPFGSGRRMCPGINLGSLMVAYPLALLLHALDWGLLDGQNPEELDMSEIFGLVLYKRVPLRVFGKARLPHDVLYPDQQESKQ